MRADARAHRPAASRRADRRAPPPPDDRASSGDAVRENAWARLAKSDAKGGSDDRMIGNTGKSGSYIPASGYHDRPIVADEFVPHSSSSSYASSSSGDDIASGVALRTRRRQRRRQDMDSADGKSKRIYTDIFWWGEGRDFILAQKNSTTRQAN